MTMVRCPARQTSMSPRFSIRPLSAQPDARLAELAAGGEERAFETLARRHRRALARYCARIGVPEHRVDDVLQQSLTKAWLSLSQGMEVREPRAWLYRIVHNAAINSIRSARRHAHDPLESLPLALVPNTGEEPDLALRARDALGHVAALPEMQRDAIVMTAIEGRSHQEAAGLLGVSDGAVRGLVHRARTTLRSAAAAVTPQGLLGLLSRLGGDAPLAERSVEISAGGAAAGATGLLAKGAVVTALAGLLAAGGSISHLGGGPDRHRSHARTPSASAVASGHAGGAESGERASRPASPAGGSAHERSGRREGGDRTGTAHRQRERRDGGGAEQEVAPLTAATAPAASGEDRASDGGEPAGRQGGGRSGSRGGSGGAAGSGGDDGATSQAPVAVDETPADLGQASVEDRSGRGGDGGSSGGGPVSDGKGDTQSSGSNGGSGQSEAEAGEFGRGGPQVSRIPG
jgi:RNA polymerase sigma factor (sigma-70 family)